MLVLNQKALDKFLKKQSVYLQEATNWINFVRLQHWSCWDELRLDFPKHRKINERWVVFKFAQRWRIEAFIDYPSSLLFIGRVGTHEAYNKWKYGKKEERFGGGDVSEND